MAAVKRTLLVIALGVLAALLVLTVRSDRVPAPPFPNVVENDWGRVEPLKQQTKQRVRDIDAQLAPDEERQNP